MKVQYKNANSPDIMLAFLVFILCVLIALFAPELVSPPPTPVGLG